MSRTVTTDRKPLIVGLIGLAVTLVVILAAYLLLAPAASPPPPPPQAVITITAEGFTPASLQVRPGTRVLWINADKAPHRVAADPHPEHSGLPGLDSQTDIAPQASYEFQFDRPGHYGYHDDLKPTSGGSVVVE